jgi:tetratricopeptide (TPR) repeat protein
MDDYISGDLTEEERTRFDAFFLSTPERREKFRFAQTLKSYISRPILDDPGLGDKKVNVIDLPPAPWWKPLLSSPYLRLAAAAMLVIGIGYLIWIVIPPKQSKGLAALNKAYSEERPVESRITGFGYAPPPPVTRGGEQEKFDYVARDRARALIQLEAAEHPNARSYHDLGRFYLTQHEFDKAIEQFEKALALDDKNAQIHSDLGAAYLERAIANSDKLNISDLDKSLEQLKRALELDNSLLPAYFNKALCLQRMNAPDQAREAWNDYLRRDADSEWSKDAERNLQSL